MTLKHYKMNILIVLVAALVNKKAFGIPFHLINGADISKSQACNFFHSPFDCNTSDNNNNNHDNGNDNDNSGGNGLDNGHGMGLFPNPAPTDPPSPSPSNVPVTPKPSDAPSPSPSSAPVTSSPSDQPVTAQPSQPSNGNQPEPGPTTAPVTSAPATTAPVPAPPTDKPSVGPSPIPTKEPSREPTLSPVENTLMAFHQFKWAAVSDECDSKTPDALIACLDGGFIRTEVQENAVCTPLSNDIQRCKPTNPYQQSFVEFACFGMMEDQLTARAEVISSDVSDCSYVMQQAQSSDGLATTYGGQAMVMAGLGRYCRNMAGNMVLNSEYECVSGIIGEEDDGDIYCVSDEACMVERMCSGEFCSGQSQCDFELDGLVFFDFDFRPECMSNAQGLDLSDADMYPSALTSFQFVEWTYSAQGLGCEWNAPPVTFTCSNGGEIYLDLETSYFCSRKDDGSTIECAPPSGEDRTVPRISHYFSIWCSGGSADQLDLIAEIQHTETNAKCAREGLAIQGVYMSRACGDLESDDFEYQMFPSFCPEGDQYYDPQQGLNPLCVEAFQCANGSCNSIELPKVVARSSDQELGTCIYAY